jgi:hypothetical protein
MLCRDGWILAYRVERKGAPSTPITVARTTVTIEVLNEGLRNLVRTPLQADALLREISEIKNPPTHTNEESHSSSPKKTVLYHRARDTTNLYPFYRVDEPERGCGGHGGG